MGALIGAATGLKLTAFIYAPVLGIGILVFTKGYREKFKKTCCFSATAIIVFLALFSPWALHLYRATGNPVFPMLNNIFHSPWWSVSITRDVRFLPKSVFEWLFYPFYWAITPSRAVSELPFHDPRMAIFLSMTFITIIIANFNSQRSKKMPKEQHMRHCVRRYLSQHWDM